MIRMEYLGPDEVRQARYLAAVSRYRGLAAEFAARGKAGLGELTAAQEEVARWEEPVEGRMRPIREVAAATGVAISTIRRWAGEGQVAAEKRYGKLWYVDPQDVELLVAMEEPGGRGWRLGRRRK